MAITSKWWKVRLLSYPRPLLPQGVGVWVDLPTRLEKLLVAHWESVNHFDGHLLLLHPLAVHIITKTANRRRPAIKSQVGIWAAAYFKRLRALAHRIADQAADSHPVENRNNSSSPLTTSKEDVRARAMERQARLLEELAIPFVFVDGPNWKLYFVRLQPRPPRNAMQDLRLCIIGPCEIGDSKNLIECYRLIKVLRAIGQWVVEDFVDWWDRFTAN